MNRASDPRATDNVGVPVKAAHEVFFSSSSPSSHFSYFSLNRPPTVEIDRRRSKSIIDNRFRQYHPIASNSRTDQLADQYVPPVMGAYRLTQKQGILLTEKGAIPDKKCYSGKEEMEKPILMEVTRSPQDLSTTPMLLAVTPFPKPLTTPPVTSTYFICLSTPAPLSITPRQRTPILPPRERRHQARGKKALPPAAKGRRIVVRRFA
ncbi:hypothetical protein BHM03_00024975 [Ensete ventricosum]|nr:hypothetical protein BHM03_00024975 [Ensete ventricosum]